ncbi:MAG: hypothetical protein AAGF20_11735 [Pseudomonadota bacterium]
MFKLQSLGQLRLRDVGLRFNAFVEPIEDSVQLAAFPAALRRRSCHAGKLLGLHDLHGAFSRNSQSPPGFMARKPSSISVIARSRVSSHSDLPVIHFQTWQLSNPYGCESLRLKFQGSRSDEHFVRRFLSE